MPALQDRLRRGDQPAAARGGRRDGQARPALHRDVGARARSSARRRASCAGSGAPCSSCSAPRPTPARRRRSTCARWTTLGERFDCPGRALRPHAGHPHLDRRGRARRRRASRSTSRSRKRLYGPDHHASLDAGGAGAPGRRRPPGRGRARHRREGARPRARPGAGDVREERRHRAARSPAGATLDASDAHHEAARATASRRRASARSSAARTARDVERERTARGGRPCLSGREGLRRRREPRELRADQDRAAGGRATATTSSCRSSRRASLAARALRHRRST